LIGGEMMEGWEGCGEKRRKGESVSISHRTNVANISPHRMYKMYLLGNIWFFLTSF
jgi:hypothetical protein